VALAGGLNEKEMAAVKAVSATFKNACESSNWDALAANYSKDAVLMPPGMEPIKGREAIQAHFAAFPPATEVMMEDVEISGEGGMAYVMGRYALTITPEGGEPMTMTGQYLDIRKRQADGTWVIVRDMYSANEPSEG
jgi:uncharacterized protein (TIGR02246 family)